MPMVKTHKYWRKCSIDWDVLVAGTWGKRVVAQTVLRKITAFFRWSFAIAISDAVAISGQTDRMSRSCPNAGGSYAQVG
jgi:hypothetical protein